MLCILILINNIEDTLQGISYHDTKFQAIGYVNDIAYVVQSKEEVNKIFSLVKSFSETGIILNDQKTQFLLTNKRMASTFYGSCNIVKTIRIVDREWTRDISESIKINEKHLEESIVRELTKYQYCFQHSLQSWIHKLLYHQ